MSLIEKLTQIENGQVENEMMSEEQIEGVVSVSKDWDYYCGNGYEFVFNKTTAEIRATQSGLARMCNRKKSDYSFKKAISLVSENEVLILTVPVPYSFSSVSSNLSECRNRTVKAYSRRAVIQVLTQFASEPEVANILDALIEAGIRTFAFEAVGIEYASQGIKNKLQQLEQQTPEIKIESGKRSLNKRNSKRIQTALALLFEYDYKMRYEFGSNHKFVIGFKKGGKYRFAEAYNMIYCIVFQGCDNVKAIKEYRGLMNLPSDKGIRDYMTDEELQYLDILEMRISCLITNYVEYLCNNHLAAPIDFTKIVEQASQECFKLGLLETQSPLLPEEFYNTIPAKDLEQAMKYKNRLANGDKRLQKLIPQTNLVKTIEGLRKEVKEDLKSLSSDNN